MASSQDDTAQLSSSPLSISLPDNHDPALRTRHSPTIGRSFDLSDPQVRERQRTMDVDMAFQLSMARRETVHHSPSASVHQTQGPPSPELNYTPIPSLSLHEEREIDIARGNGIAATDEVADDETIGPLHLESPPSLSDLDTRRPQPSDDAIIFSTREGNIPLPQAHPQEDDAISARYDLPTYQANVPCTTFDFEKMEEFATREKTKLGLSSPVDLRARRLAHSNAVTNSIEEPSVVQQFGEPSSEVPSPPAPDGTKPLLSPSSTQFPSPIAEDTTTGRSLRHRKLSQSNPRPRSHRKGIGGKLAMFENSGNGNPSTLSARLGAVISAGGSGGGGQDHFVPPHSHRDGLSGILNTGHDRPFRFSFYSNALSATIHARSLSELPAEGQSFKDLFTGMHPPSSPDFRRGRVDIHRVNGTSRHPYDVSKSGNYDMRNNGSSDTDSTTWWLDVTSPTEEEMKLLSEVFSIHPLTTEDILMEETREKIELFRNYYFVCFRSFEQDQYSPTYLEPLNMYIIVFREGILSFHFQPTPHPQNVRRRIKQFRDYISVTSDWISYALIDDITDAFGPLIQGIEYEVDSIDELVLILKEAEQSDMLRRIGTCRKKVMGLLRLMGNKADVVKGLAKRCNENWRVAPTSDIGLYLSDIQDHLITMTQNLNHYEKILSRSHSNYLAQISIEMTDANNQINDVLSKLTALGTVLIPMNLITGLWGMNVHVPGQEVPGYGWFIGIIVFLAAFALLGGYGTYRLMIRK